MPRSGDHRPPAGATKRALSTLEGCGSSSGSLPRIGPLRPPGGSFEGFGEVLRLAHDVARAKLHDAHGVVRFPVVGDDQFGDPQLAAAAHAPDDELPPCRVAATLALDVASPAEPLARLWIVVYALTS